MEEYEYIKKIGKSSDLNYDLFPLINNFSFINMIELPKRGIQLEDYGAYIVITDKQYIIGYTAKYGEGSHRSAFARTQKELLGGGIINNYSDGKVLTDMCINNNISAKINYAKSIINESAKYVGYIDFDLTDTIITQSKFEMFKLLYDKYNQELLYLSSKGKGFKVNYRYMEKNRVLRNETDSLDSLYLYLENHITNDYINTNDEIIIGETIKKIVK